MSLQDLVGDTYGPFGYRTDPEKVGEYASVVGAVGADTVPRSLVGALLFQVAPCLLADERVADATASVIHGDQSFDWYDDFPVGAALAVTGRVARIRERAGVFFTAFEMEVTHGDDLLASGSSTFLLAAGSATGAVAPAERPEPGPSDGSVAIIDGSISSEESGLGRFGASRADLVRYAGASRDWNPIHWDHGAAVGAGLPGVVVHGLFQSGWMVEAAVALGLVPTKAKFRYRRPLPAGVIAGLSGRVTESGLSLALGDDGGPYTTATFG